MATQRVNDLISTTNTHPYRYLWTPLSGPPGVVDTYYDYLVDIRKLCMVDYVTPGWKRLQNQGILINNPCWREDLHYVATPLIAEANWWYNTIPGRMIWPRTDCGLEIPNKDGTLPDIQLFQHFFDEYEHYEALASNRAFANVQVSESMLLVTLGELPETLKWLRSILTRGINLTKWFRSATKLSSKDFITFKNFFSEMTIKDVEKLLNRKTFKKNTSKSVDQIKTFSGAWLEYRYAIRPLIFEMKACLKALSTIIKKGTRQTARGKEVNLVDTLMDGTHTFVTGGSVTETAYSQAVKATYSCRAGILFEIDQDLDAMLSVWGLDQPVESVYELIPFSFIADWFFSIGDTISAWSINPSLRPLISWVTYKFSHMETRETTGMTMNGINGYSFTVTNLTHGSSGLNYVRYWRKPVAERSVLPRFDLKLDLAKIIDLGFIGRQLLSGKRPYQKGA